MAKQQSSYKLLTPEERAKILYFLKKGPKLEDRQTLADFTAQIYKQVTGRNLKEHCDAVMNEWRRNNRGKATANETFVW